MGKLMLTAEVARCAAVDAANRSMRAADRRTWNQADMAAYLAEVDRLAPMVPGWTPENPL